MIGSSAEDRGPSYDGLDSQGSFVNEPTLVRGNGSMIRQLVFAVLFVASVVLSGLWNLAKSNASPDNTNSTVRYTPRDGREVLLVYFGSSTCSACDDPDLPTILSSIRSELESYLERDSTIHLVNIGVAVDHRVAEGLEHLEQVGPFDEIVVGRGWFNEAARRFMFSDYPGRAGTPSLVLFTQDRSTADPSRGPVVLTNGRVLDRRNGLREIRAWLDEPLLWQRFLALQ
jgi:hypothetical protein